MSKLSTDGLIRQRAREPGTHGAREPGSRRLKTSIFFQIYIPILRLPKTFIFMRLCVLFLFLLFIIIVIVCVIVIDIVIVIIVVDMERANNVRCIFSETRRVGTLNSPLYYQSSAPLCRTKNFSRKYEIRLDHVFCVNTI